MAQLSTSANARARRSLVELPCRTVLAQPMNRGAPICPNCGRVRDVRMADVPGHSFNPRPLIAVAGAGALVALGMLIAWAIGPPIGWEASPSPALASAVAQATPRPAPSRHARRRLRLASTCPWSRQHQVLLDGRSPLGALRPGFPQLHHDQRGGVPGCRSPHLLDRSPQRPCPALLVASQPGCRAFGRASGHHPGGRAGNGLGQRAVAGHARPAPGAAPDADRA
jgi:hypothetical protein